MATTFTLRDGRPLAYNLSLNPTNGPVVLLANSLTSDHTSWDHVVERLVSRGFRPLRFDQPGHGGSGVPRDLSSTSFSSMADDVAALLKHLGLARIHAWIGVSMGAAMSVYFLAQHPGVVDRVVICDTISASPVNAGVPDAFGDRVAGARREGSLDAVRAGTLERWFGREWLAAHPDEAARVEELMKTTTLDGFETCCAALRSQTFDLEPLLGKVAAGCEDALLVVGEKDADLPVKMEDMRAKIEKGFRDAGKNRAVELRVIKNAGHVCFIDGLEPFCGVVIPFLEKR
ncbi:related to 3-oxoadipate enol-lactonase II [Cephalotrichum gorgonifer]|uniref:Related to 3-oxoadipate enol-lactonase II n=1 Tax=Cephalotrichum gorgonifer TaxID=2041049 RepID=A0AAE8SV94_9PEZI|nr:related to 3-oxoadipate enol-lactonase II [Cephalotrichum gorgonifer]